MTEQYVVDASVVAKLYLKDEQHTGNAELLFSRFEDGQLELLAPRIITYEVPAAIKKGADKARVPEAAVLGALDSFQSLGMLILDDSAATQEAMNLALAYECQFYDALYVLLAEDLGCRFITADEKMYRKLHRRDLSYAVFIASYQ